jgi:nucleoside-diphosphate-sugar epimerase
MNKKILVIGSNGFIAGKLISELVKVAHVTGVYNLNRDNLSKEIRNVPINKLANLSANFDEVYLLSAFIPGNNLVEKGRKEMFKVNVQLVDFICKKFSKSRIIFSSSVSVYKPKDSEIFENDDEGGINEYGVSKLWGERIIQRVMNFSIVRISSVYGVGMKLNTIIPNYIKEALEKKVITIWGEGKRMQNYIHVSDVANFLMYAASVAQNDIFLATSSKSFSNLQVAEIISQKTGCSLSFKNDDASPSFFYNNDYTKKKLKYYPKVSIEQGITELIECLKEKY